MSAGGAAQAGGVIRSLGSFPELAALEASFQQHVQLVQGGAAAAAAGAQPASPASGLASRSPSPSRLSQSLAYSDIVATGSPGSSPEPGGGPGSASPQAAAATAAAAPVQPEPKALTWAQRNAWFGGDAELTAFAYQVHDTLVGPEGVDPSSDAYYSAIEQRVAARFPQRWASYHAAAPVPPASAPAGLQQAAAVAAWRTGGSQRRRGGGGLLAARTPIKDPTPTVAELLAAAGAAAAGDARRTTTSSISGGGKAGQLSSGDSAGDYRPSLSSQARGDFSISQYKGMQAGKDLEQVCGRGEGLASLYQCPGGEYRGN